MYGGGNALVVRDINTNLVRKTLKGLKTATRRDIASRTGLSVVTVASALRNLEESGEILPLDIVPSNGGRPSQRFRYNENHAHVLAVFTHEKLEKDTAFFAVADLYGSCVQIEEEELTTITVGSFEPGIERMLRAYPTVRALGFGLPGIELNGTLVTLDYSRLVGTDFSGRYGKRFGLPVVVENDVNAAALGYCRRNGISSEAATAYLYFPRNYPPGAGICIGGKLYRGNKRFAGEISRIPLGIPWGKPGFFDDPEEACNAVAKTVAAIAAVLSPETVILQGEFLTEWRLKTIRKKCRNLLPKEFCPALVPSHDFNQDYRDGLIAEALELTERDSASARRETEGGT